MFLELCSKNWIKINYKKQQAMFVEKIIQYEDVREKEKEREGEREKERMGGRQRKWSKFKEIERGGKIRI